MKIKNILLYLGALLLFLNYSCSKMNDLHEKYLQEGERVYVAQPDTVKAISGANRILLKYWLSDPKVAKMKIYWSNHSDSLLTDVTATTHDKPNEIIIANLKPGNYTFRIVTYNKNLEHPSIPLDVVAEVYSDSYMSRLFPRQIKYANYISADSVYVYFSKSTDKSVASVISYTNTANRTVNKIVPIDLNFILLEEFKENIKFYTSFLPFEGALDTLNSVPKKFSRIDMKVDKSSLKRWNPPGIPYVQLSNDWSIEKMWDENYLGTSYLQNNITTYPHDFTFDLGRVMKINRIKQWQRWTTSILFADQQIKRFELWGSATPDVTKEFTGWTILGIFTAVKPSGKTTNEAIDIEYAQAGEDFMIMEDAPPVRYIRYRILELWKATNAAAVGELNFYSIDE